MNIYDSHDTRAIARAVADELERRKDAPPSQLKPADLAAMSPEQIRKAQDEGRLKAVLAGER